MILAVIGIVFILNASRFISKPDSMCSKLAEYIPDTVDCPSFDEISKNVKDPSISLFCRMLAHRFCFYPLSSTDKINSAFENVLCTTPFTNFDTRIGLGLELRKEIKVQFNTECRIFKLNKNLIEIRILSLARR